MKSRKNQTTFFIVESALFAALIYVATCYIKIPTVNGYVHIGDGLIFLASSLLPPQYAIAAAILGGSLGDIIGGYFIWVPATALIKGFTAACFSSKTKKIISARNIIALFISLILCVGGYYLFEAVFIADNFISPLASVLPNVGQIVSSSAVYICLGVIIDIRPRLKKLLTEPKDMI